MLFSFPDKMIGLLLCVIIAITGRVASEGNLIIYIKCDIYNFEAIKSLLWVKTTKYS